MVDTTSQELLIEEKTILKFTSSALFFFSNDANGTSDFADCLTNMCISNCVRSVFFFSNHGWLYVQWTFVIVTYQIDIFDKYVGGHLSLACKFKFKRIQIRDCECFFPFHLLFFSLFVVVVFYFSLFLLFIMPLKLIKLQTQKNVGLVIIQGVVRGCSIEGRQKTVSNSLVSISEIKANL